MCVCVCVCVVVYVRACFCEQLYLWLCLNDFDCVCVSPDVAGWIETNRENGTIPTPFVMDELHQEKVFAVRDVLHGVRVVSLCPVDVSHAPG